MKISHVKTWTPAAYICTFNSIFKWVYIQLRSIVQKLRYLFYKTNDFCTFSLTLQLFLKAGWSSSVKLYSTIAIAMAAEHVCCLRSVQEMCITIDTEDTQPMIPAMFWIQAWHLNLLRHGFPKLPVPFFCCYPDLLMSEADWSQEEEEKKEKEERISSPRVSVFSV